MANKPKNPDHVAQNICGAKLKGKRKGVCRRAPMPNGRCHIHGGKSTGPKNSLAYYRKTLGVSDEAADIEKPMDLTGELAFIRTLLMKMQQNPLKAYCVDCKQWVIVDIECPNKVHDEKGKEHFVSVKDNDYSKIISATKLLGDVAKAHKEIEQGKQVNINIEVINILVTKVIEAYGAADYIADPEQRKAHFVGSLQRLLVSPIQQPVSGEGTSNSKKA